MSEDDYYESLINFSGWDRMLSEDGAQLFLKGTVVTNSSNDDSTQAGG